MIRTTKFHLFGNTSESLNSFTAKNANLQSMATKILWISSWYPNEYSPFNGDFIQRMAEAVSPHCNIAVLNAVEANTEKVEIVEKKGNLPTVQVFFPANFRKRNFFTHAIRALRYFLALQKGMSHFKKMFGKPDIVHLHVAFPAGIFALFYASFHNIPLIYTEHWAGFSKENASRLFFAQKALARLIGKKAKVILPVSDSLRNDMISIGIKGNYKIIPNVLDIQVFKHETKKSPSTDFTFIHVSNLTDNTKNVSGIIRAFSLASNKLCSLRLVIVGDGKDALEMKKLVNQLGLNEKVKFAGQISYLEVASEFKKAHSFVLFSRYETFSCVLLEALYLGLPIISSRCGGISEWITDETGVLVKSEDEQELAKAMEKVVKNYGNFNFEKIRSRVEECSYETVGCQIFNLYK